MATSGRKTTRLSSAGGAGADASSEAEAKTVCSSGQVSVSAMRSPTFSAWLDDDVRLDTESGTDDAGVVDDSRGDPALAELALWPSLTSSESDDKPT